MSTRRQGVRHEVDVAATIMFDGGSVEYKVRIRDLSNWGANVECSRVASDSIVSITSLGHTMIGKVMWSDEIRFGMRFSEAIDDETVAKLKKPRREKASTDAKSMHRSR